MGWGAFAAAQRTYIYNEPEVLYKSALELYQKQKYSSAFEGFEEYLRHTASDSRNHISSAKYFQAACATELFHNNAEGLLLSFLRDYPESPMTSNAHFQLGRVYFRDKKFSKALTNFGEVQENVLSRDEWYEYQYKMGYCHYEADHYKEALEKFKKIKDSKSMYSVPATYYYAHLQYIFKNWNEALENFRKIENEKAFKGLVPYYIAQIDYWQKKYN